MKKLILLLIISASFFYSTTRADNFSSENYPDANRLLAWAESQYPSLFAPANGSSQQWEGWYYIYYPNTKNYIGVNIDGEVWVLGDSWHNEMKYISTFYTLLANVPNATRTTNKLNDTGITFGGIYGRAVDRVYGNNITWAGGYVYGNNTTCAGTAINAQDCSHGRDVNHNDESDGHAGFSFTKLDANGNNLPTSEKNWSCVRDNVTQLIWEVKTDNGDVHDKSNIYPWGGVTALGSGAIGKHYDAWDKLVNGSNDESLCGYTDWRVPTHEELLSLIDYSDNNSSIDRDYFPNIFFAVWSSSPRLAGSAPWHVHFGSHNNPHPEYQTDQHHREYKMQVMLVRGKL